VVYPVSIMRRYTLRELEGMNSEDVAGMAFDWQKRLAEATALLERLNTWNETEGSTDDLVCICRDSVDFLYTTPSPPAEPAPSLVEQTARLEVISSHRDTLQEAWETAASQAVTPAERAVLDATGFFDELNLCALERSGQEVFAAAVRSLRAAREAGGR
jgi:hypothetical protein